MKKKLIMKYKLALIKNINNEKQIYYTIPNNCDLSNI